MADKKKLQSYIDEHAAEYIEISHKIWEYAELSLQEYKSAALYKEKLKAEGFYLKENLADIETAFCGIFAVKDGKVVVGGDACNIKGAGNCNTNCNTGKSSLDWETLPHPIVGILAEFDALSGLSQKAGATEKEPLMGPDGVKCSSGHGCGHNMLGAAAFGAASAVKALLSETDKALTGTLIFYGCPGEEGGAAKAFLGREREWAHLDAALTWHPGDKNEVTSGTNNACTQVLYKFKGISAHAAGNPEMGRSALDAVELMNTGVQYLREHMKKEASVHYAITDAGGISPNVVQAEASVLYMVRSQSVPDTLELQRRVDLIADGAALMTETSYERIFVDGTADLVPNTCLEKVLHENLSEVPLPQYTAEEMAYAQAIFHSYPHAESYGATCAQGEEGQEEDVKEGTLSSPISMKVEPFKTSDDFEAGSTDVGDVSHLAPTAQFTAVTFTLGAPGHSWQNTSCGGSSLGDKGTIYAAKVLAGAAVDLFERPSLIDDAKAEFEKRTAGKPYVCPIPDGIKPYVI